ncbi:MAG: S41 family peptidase, partial [Pedobacter sp.]|nr:S41 family peptidase [Pedobacter sp.]
VLSSGNRKIGFIAYNSFTDEGNSSRFLDPVFTEFSQKGISELIIDLRYNGGGYQNSVVYIANQICPTKARGAVMFTEHYNQMMQQGKAEILSKQLLRDSNNEPFYIDGRLATLYDIDYSEGANTVTFDTNNGLTAISKIYFIVSAQTASASELLINVLKPYTEVKLIGVSASGQQQVRTYGKPVGFFDIDIDKYELYVAMYQNKNANDEGDYYEGFLADYSTLDDPTHDFASLDDPAIQIALGSVDVTSRAVDRIQRKQSVSSTAKYIFNTDRLDGTIKVSNDFKFRKDRRKP